MRRFEMLVGSSAALVAALLCSGAAGAALPGANGEIAYVTSTANGTAQIFSVAPGGSPIPLTSTGASMAPSWSPDGTQIAYAHWEWATVSTTGADIWVARADGSGARQLTNDPAWETDPAWSADGSLIAFERGDGAGDSISIWTMPARGGAPTLVHQGGFAPAWSPDGKRIAFVAGGSNTFERGGTIWVMNADGSGVTALARAPGRDYWPDWSPDGRTIAFFSLRSGSWEVWLVNVDGSGLRQLSSGGAGCDARCEIPRGDPAWSPDGSKIAYATATALVTINADGTGRSEIAPLTKVGANPTGMPAWQPLTNLAVSAALRHAKQPRTLTATISTRNTSGLTAANVKLTVSVSGAGSRLLGTSTTHGSCVRGVCTIPALAAHAAATITVRIEARRRGPITLRATATTSTPEATTADNTATARKTS